MSNIEELLKINGVILTSEAIEYLSYLQEESNSSLKCFRQELLEAINSAHLLLQSPDIINDTNKKKVIGNLTQLSILYYDLEKLFKP